MALETFSADDTLDDGEVYGQFTNQEGNSGNGAVSGGCYISTYPNVSDNYAYLITTADIGSVFDYQVEFTTSVTGYIMQHVGIYLGNSRPTTNFDSDSDTTGLVDVWLRRSDSTFRLEVTRTNSSDSRQYWNFSTNLWQIDETSWDGFIPSNDYRVTIKRDATNTVIEIYDITGDALVETITAVNSETKAIADNVYFYFGSMEDSGGDASTVNWDNAGVTVSSPSPSESPSLSPSASASPSSSESPSLSPSASLSPSSSKSSSESPSLSPSASLSPSSSMSSSNSPSLSPSSSESPSLSPSSSASSSVSSSPSSSPSFSATVPDVVSVKSALKLTTTKEINGLWHAFMEIEQDDYILPECYIEFDDEWYITKRIEKTVNRGYITYRVYMDHIMSELNDYTLAPFDTTGTATSLLTTILSGTGWDVGTVDISGDKRIFIDRKETVLAVLNQMVAEYVGELYFHSANRTVDFKSSIGAVTKQQVRYDKNSTYIMRSEDSTKLITRLYVYGKNDIGIASVNPTGEAYLDSGNIGDYKDVKAYTIYYDEITDEVELLALGQAYLAIYKIPIYSYKVNMADLSVVPTWNFEKTKLGDTIRVYNKDIKLNSDVRVKKIVRDLSNPERLRIELENTAESLAKDLSEIITGLRDVRAKTEDTSSDITFIFTIKGELEVEENPCPALPAPRNCTIDKVYVYVKTAPTMVAAGGDAIIIDINNNGSTIFPGVYLPDGPAIQHNEQTAESDTPYHVGTDNYKKINKNDVIAIDLDQVGDLVTGADLTVEVRCK